MSSADEVTLVYAVNGANLNASATAGAERIIYSCEIVYYCYCSVRTGLLALHTANTAVRAIFACESALVVIGALYDNTGGVVNEVNDSVGTFAYADSAADALTGIYSCNTVFDRYSILGANLYTVAVAKAGEGTELVTAVSEVGVKAGFVSYVIVLSGNNVARAVTSYVSNPFNNVISFNTEYDSDLLCGRVTAGNAEISLICFAFGESLRIAVTARVAASSAVSAGETVADCNRGLVLFNTEEHRRKSEKHSAEECDSKQNKYRN